MATSHLDPRQAYSCFSVTLRAAASPHLYAGKPVVAEHILELLYRLAAGPATGPPTLDLLRAARLFSAQLDGIACRPLPEEAHAQVATNKILYSGHHPEETNTQQ